MSGGRAEEYWGAVYERIIVRAEGDGILARVIAHRDFETFAAQIEAMLAARAER